MDDCYRDNYNNGLVDSTSYIIYGKNEAERDKCNATADQFRSRPVGKKMQKKKNKVEEICFQVSRQVSVPKKTSAGQKNQSYEDDNNTQIENSNPYCHVKLDSIIKLQDSTRKLLNLLNDIQSKTHSKELPTIALSKNEVKPIEPSDGISLVTDVVITPALQKLENQTKTLNSIYTEDEDDDCSIFKRLTRKCNCLNQMEYNDFVIHFNEDTKYFTSTIGEIIKNMRILKKFLYMGSKYTKNALVFLNEGFADSAYTEKVEITQGCSHSDMCNVFEDHSIVVTCISWPCKIEYYGDSVTQKLAASFVYQLAQLEEGRRYLKFTSKITNDIKKVLRKRESVLDLDTTEFLNATLNLMHPPMTQFHGSYFCKPTNEDYGNEIVNSLVEYRNYMTLDEVFTHLDFLHNLSNEEKGKIDLTSLLPTLLLLFKEMLNEYDNSEMNIIITNILNNIVSKNMLKHKEPFLPKTMVMAHTATEPIIMRNEVIQMPSQKKVRTKKTSHKSKSYLGTGPNKFRQASRYIGSEWECPRLLNRSKKFTKDMNQIIVVPIEKTKTTHL